MFPWAGDDHDMALIFISAKKSISAAVHQVFTDPSPSHLKLLLPEEAYLHQHNTAETWRSHYLSINRLLGVFASRFSAFGVALTDKLSGEGGEGLGIGFPSDIMRIIRSPSSWCCW